MRCRGHRVAAGGDGGGARGGGANYDWVMKFWFGLALWVSIGSTAWVNAQELRMVPGRDSVTPTTFATDAPAEATAVLEGLGWEGGEFDITVIAADEADFDARVAFDSPLPMAEDETRRVVLRWYAAGSSPADAAAKGDDSADRPSAAVLVVHSLHPDMPVATMLARGLSGRGVHAFVLELPGYGLRREEPPRMTGVTALLQAKQAVTDTRRSYDAVRALAEHDERFGIGRPIDPDRIAVQGTSLGSFVAATAAAIDGCFSETFLLLSGGDGVEVLTDGQKDAFHVRNALRHYGYTDDDSLLTLIRPIEPLTIAHRLDPQTTWMYNAGTTWSSPGECRATGEGDRAARGALALDAGQPLHRVFVVAGCAGAHVQCTEPK